MISKFFKEFAGNKSAFQTAGYETTYANNIVLIKDEANNGAGACIYARGSYFGNFAELIAALTYIKNIKVGENTYSREGGATLEFASGSNSQVVLDVVNGKVTISLTPTFVQSVNDVIAEVATIKGDYLTSADRTAIEGLIASAKSEILGNAETDTKDSKTIEGVRKYVDAKTSDIASNSDFSTLKGRVDTIESDYLKGADKTELQGAIDVEKGRIDTIVADYLKAADKTELSNRIKAVEDDYLKAADKTELEGKINEDRQRLATIEGQDAGKSAREIVQDEVAKQLQSENITESFDTLKEMAEYLSSHPEDVTKMNANIKQNADDIDAIEKEIENLATSESLGALEARVKANEDGLAAVPAAIEAAEGRAKSHADTKVSEAEGRINTKLADYAKTADVNTELGKKADAATTYSKTEVDGLVSPKADKSYVDTELGKKANTGDSYLKSETYTQAEVQAMFDSAFAWERIEA